MVSVDLLDDVERSADPGAVARALERIDAAHPGAADRWMEDAGLRSALIAVAGASPWLTRVCVTDPTALDVLSDLDRTRQPVLMRDEDPRLSIARAKRLELLRIAARDLLGMDGLEEVGAGLARLAASLLQVAADAASVTDLAVIGMGKLGAGELNYSSDVDLVLVTADGAHAAPVRPFLDLARVGWRIDLDLRPEGRSGPLTRSLSSYLAYWDRWAETWEFQALLKARAVAGEADLGRAFEQEAAGRVWGRPFGADEVRQIRQMKGRGEDAVSRQGLADREVKRGKGGIRDIEFSVQLLQLVHGRADPSLRTPATLPALAALAAGGYMGADDAETLASAYRFLRTVEHRLQLFEDQQLHTVPTGAAQTRLARVLGYRDHRSGSAAAQFEGNLRRLQARVRAIHERLFFRPLLEAFTASRPGTGAGNPPLTSEAVVARLQAFGFTDAERTTVAIRELTKGFSRSSRLMAQALPMLLDWLSGAPDPDLGLLGLRTLSSAAHHRDQLTALCRESPDGARQLCCLLGTGARFARAFQGHPELLGGLATGETLVDRTRGELDERIAGTLTWRSGEGAVEAGLRVAVRAETLRIAARDVLDLADVDATGRALCDLAEATVAAALRAVAPPLPFAVVGMGRLGGRELAYRSDLDLLFVYEPPPGAPAAEAAAQAEAAAGALTTMLSGATPATGVYRVDAGLRPEGRQGPLARSIDAYAAYYGRWAQVWERQALLRGRFVAGDEAVGRRFAEVATSFVWDRPLTAEEVREIRRTKARIERERVPAGEDPAFHLKLGPGSLSDIEWTCQLLQLQHGIREAGTLAALDALADGGFLSAGDHGVLVDGYRFCERTRNRLGLVWDTAGDSLPTTGPHLTTLARSLATTPTGLRDDYRRHARRVRRVVERLFYGGPAGR